MQELERRLILASFEHPSEIKIDCYLLFSYCEKHLEKWDWFYWTWCSHEHKLPLHYLWKIFQFLFLADRFWMTLATPCYGHGNHKKNLTWVVARNDLRDTAEEFIQRLSDELEPDSIRSLILENPSRAYIIFEVIKNSFVLSSNVISF